MTRLSRYLLPTEKQAPADAEALSHKLLVRAGMIRQVGSGLWTWMPAGWRVHRKVEQIIREELDAIGSGELLMPVLQPAELWQRSGRYGITELMKLKDRKGADMVLAMTHEECVTFHVAQHRALLPRPAAVPLPLPDEGARRAAPARRRPAHARVHHEGRVHVRPRPRGARRELRAARARLRPDLRPGRARVVQRRVRRRDDGRRRRPRVHGAVPRGGERRRARAGLRRERRGRQRGRAARRAARPAARARAVGDAGDGHRRRRRGRARRARGRAAQGLPGDHRTAS